MNNKELWLPPIIIGLILIGVACCYFFFATSAKPNNAVKVEGYTTEFYEEDAGNGSGLREIQGYRCYKYEYEGKTYEGLSEDGFRTKIGKGKITVFVNAEYPDYSLPVIDYTLARLRFWWLALVGCLAIFGGFYLRHKYS